MTKRKISNNAITENEKINNIDFNSDCITLQDLETHNLIKYQYIDQNQDQIILGESTNQLFSLITDCPPSAQAKEYGIVKIFKKLNFDPNTVLDSNRNNILHYAAFAWDLERINDILNGFNSNIVKSLLNHHNLDGTSPLGMTFFNTSTYNNILSRIEIATEFAALKEYSINSYLNTKGMDFINLSEMRGGSTLLHKVISLAANRKEPTKEETRVISEFFKTLKKRNNEAEDKDLFNPDYPIMNPRRWKYNSQEKNLYSFTKKACFIRSEAKSQPVIKKVNDKKETPLSITPNKKTEYSVNPKTTFFLEETSKTSTDLHMVTTSLLLDKIKFQSKKLQALCKKHFNALKSDYEVRQFEDDSGDSEEEGTPANEYKKHLLNFNELIEKGMKGRKLQDKTNKSVNDSRTFDHYRHKFGILSPGISKEQDNISNKTQDSIYEYNEEKWNKYFNNTDDNQELPLNLDEKIVIPLFHGVPFMSSQYTNHERREVMKKFIEINNKLISRYSKVLNKEELNSSDDLTEKEKILINIHSRTATASTGMQSLYEMINSELPELNKLNEIDNNLHNYFAKTSTPSFNEAMKIYVFNFADGKTRKFWDNIKQSHTSKEYPDHNIIKYRFPVIATSKTPDHPAKFAIGNNVEENVRGEMSMKPEYTDGKPTHRAAGLLYVTLHKLGDLKEAFKNHTAIDINRAMSLKEINPNAIQQSNLRNQVECDFLGKMKGEVIAVIPIIYPHIRTGNKFEKEYHQAIWGINPNNQSKGSITNPSEILENLETSPNPSVANTEKFGRLMLPTIVNLANGMVLAASRSQEKFPCSITENNDLVPYNLKFEHDNDGASLSFMHRELTSSTKAALSPNKSWENSIEKSQKEKSTLNEDIPITELMRNMNFEENKGKEYDNNNYSNNYEQDIVQAENPVATPEQLVRLDNFIKQMTADQSYSYIAAVNEIQAAITSSDESLHFTNDQITAVLGNYGIFP